MTLLTPHKNETRSDFVLRFMANDTAKEEYPDNRQRLVVCATQWRNRDMLNIKICSKCKEKYSATTEFFHKDISKKDGLYPSCKKCSNKQKGKYRKVSRKYLKMESKKYYSNNKKRILAKSRNDYKKNINGFKDKIKERGLINLYNITLEDYNNLLQKQNFSCAICGKHVSELSHNLYIDHDHNTNKVRGLLCQKCNSMIGFSSDNIDILLNAIKYLKEIN